MTAVELFSHLQAHGVSLIPAPDGTVRCRALRDTLTPALVAIMREHKTALHDLVEAYEERQALGDTVTVAASDHPPLTDVRSLRQWVTGQIPDTAQVPILAPLPAPLSHDTPSTPVTYWGEPCTVNACQKAAPESKRSLRYAPSGTCVQCWQRWDKRVTREEPPP